MKPYSLAVIGLALLGATPAWGQSPAACCPPAGCCAPCENVCVPEHYCKETKKWVYNSGCEQFCLCYFPSLFGHCGCESGHCEHPHTRHYLVKKPRVCKEDAVKCVLAPAGCGGVPCCAPGSPYFPAAQGPMSAAPVPMPVMGPRYGSPMPAAYGAPEMPAGAFGGGSAFTPAAPPPTAFGTPATAFTPR